MHTINRFEMHALFFAPLMLRNKGLAEDAADQRRRGVSKPKPAPWKKWIALLIVLAVVFIAWQYVTRDEVVAAVKRARTMGWAGYAAFVVGYAAWSAVGLPASLPSLVAAA